jgi:RNA polymerase sigma factor (sigma-70 family)
MSDVSRVLSQIEQGDPLAPEKLLPLVYDELKKLAAAKLAQEKPGQTLQATALVHEAYLRLVGRRPEQVRAVPADSFALTPVSCTLSPVTFNSRGHFFAAAAEAMRRILTDAARRKMAVRHGGQAAREELPLEAIQSDSLADPAETLAVHELLDQLAAKHPRKAEVVKLRYFVGCSQEEAAQILGITPDVAQADWVFARAWLKRAWGKGDGSPASGD